MNAKVAADLYRYGGLTGRRGFLRGLLIPGFRYTYILRCGEKYRIGSFGNYFYRFVLRRYQYKYGIQIPIGTKIDSGLFINHFGNITVIGNAIIGKNCNIHQGVTIGYVQSGKRMGAPTIGDNVWIGPNAVIVGNIHIGNNVLIAPNSFVNFDVPSDSVIMPPQRHEIKHNPKATEGFIISVKEISNL